VQFEYDFKLEDQVEGVTTPNPDSSDPPDLLSFGFFEETDCLWSGQLQFGFGLISAEWSNQWAESIG
jgi:hypothetical protein